MEIMRRPRPRRLRYIKDPSGPRAGLSAAADDIIETSRSGGGARCYRIAAASQCQSDDLAPSPPPAAGSGCPAACNQQDRIVRAQARWPVMVYSAASQQIHAALAQAFDAGDPELEVEAVLGLNGPVAASATAEKDNPQRDALYSFNIFFMQALKRAAVFAPPGVRGSRIAGDFRDLDDFFVSHWITVNGSRLQETRRDQP